MAERGETRADRILARIKDHWLLSALVVIGVVVIALSQVARSVDDLRHLFAPGTRQALGREMLAAEYCTLLVPLVVQLDRTKDAFDRWNSRNLPLETLTIRDGNLKARELLEKHSQLVPSDLQEARRKLVEHYDRWLEEYQKLREGPEADPDQPFVFVGPEGYPFPADAADRFRARLESVQSVLGGQAACR